MKLNAKDFPKMSTFIATHGTKLPKSCVDRAFMSIIAGESIPINPHIVHGFNTNIALLAALFYTKYKNAENTYGESMYDGYYKNPEERKLLEREKYQQDEDGQVWFAYSPEDIIRDTGLPAEVISDGICFLLEIDALDLFEETTLTGTKMWFTFYHEAYYGMTTYAVWKTDEYCVCVNEEEEEYYTKKDLDKLVGEEDDYDDTEEEDGEEDSGEEDN